MPTAGVEDAELPRSTDAQVDATIMALVSIRDLPDEVSAGRTVVAYDEPGPIADDDWR
jgi:hypothetical protein